MRAWNWNVTDSKKNNFDLITPRYFPIWQSKEMSHDFVRSQWWDEWDDTALQTHDSKFKPWRSEVEHATSQSRRFPTILHFYKRAGKKHFVSFSNYVHKGGLKPLSFLFISFLASIWFITLRYNIFLHWEHCHSHGNEMGITVRIIFPRRRWDEIDVPAGIHPSNNPNIRII